MLQVLGGMFYLKIIKQKIDHYGRINGFLIVMKKSS